MKTGQLTERRREIRQLLPQHVLHRIGVEGKRAGQQPVEDHSHGVQVGQVLAIRDGQSGKDVVLDITDRVEYGGEQGLLGLAFSVDGRYLAAENGGAIYVYGLPSP